MVSLYYIIILFCTLMKYILPLLNGTLGYFIYEKNYSAIIIILKYNI